jgi:hypothetical protein
VRQAQAAALVVAARAARSHPASSLSAAALADGQPTLSRRGTHSSGGGGPPSCEYADAAATLQGSGRATELFSQPSGDLCAGETCGQPVAGVHLTGPQRNSESGPGILEQDDERPLSARWAGMGWRGGLEGEAPAAAPLAPPPLSSWRGRSPSSRARTYRYAPMPLGHAPADEAAAAHSSAPLLPVEAVSAPSVDATACVEWPSPLTSHAVDSAVPAAASPRVLLPPEAAADPDPFIGPDSGQSGDQGYAEEPGASCAAEVAAAALASGSPSSERRRRSWGASGSPLSSSSSSLGGLVSLVRELRERLAGMPPAEGCGGHGGGSEGGGECDPERDLEGRTRVSRFEVHPELRDAGGSAGVPLYPPEGGVSPGPFLCGREATSPEDDAGEMRSEAWLPGGPGLGPVETASPCYGARADVSSDYQSSVEAGEEAGLWEAEASGWDAGLGHQGSREAGDAAWSWEAADQGNELLRDVGRRAGPASGPLSSAGEAVRPRAAAREPRSFHGGVEPWGHQAGAGAGSGQHGVRSAAAYSTGVGARASPGQRHAPPGPWAWEGLPGGDAASAQHARRSGVHAQEPGKAGAVGGGVFAPARDHRRVADQGSPWKAEPLSAGGGRGASAGSDARRGRPEAVGGAPTADTHGGGQDQALPSAQSMFARIRAQLDALQLSMASPSAAALDGNPWTNPGIRHAAGAKGSVGSGPTPDRAWLEAHASQGHSVRNVRS